jgi:hypothetical protein
MLEVRQSNEEHPGGIKLSLGTLVLCAMGGQHRGPPSHRKEGMQVFGDGGRLLH